MARLPFWTKLGRKLRRMWLCRLARILRLSSRRPRSKNRYAPLGTKKRYRIKSRSTILKQNKKRRYRRRGPNYAFVEFFVASLLCAVVFPFELLGRLFQPVKKKSTRRSANSNTARTPLGQKSSHNKNAHTTTEHRSAATTPSTTKSIKIEITETASSTTATYTAVDIIDPPTYTIKEETVEEGPPDENTPKSTPKHPNDQYIRKRMIIAGSYYCDKAVLNKLHIGTYFDMALEPDNPHDKDAVMLTFEGEKIGYIPKTDKIAFVTCLRLKRKVYCVITDVIIEDGRSKYEFETWFDRG